ncbi:MAG: NAD-dependent epimerase/dehydratase [Candidatus Gottesmanbacteria bacterium GW2011_GWA1_34_13]|uniref:NAD-dependent epimerase/dehydratase n=1 Tax=Candidatus Gottesmanbacteria bacterium GW2011_GWA1_34_13 TaxID=1618434 RepID=A0A0G0ASA2_9BACT|nr:MAG: NAD-dependent epimerase/dehydratase [Candidatus Gottesmanbacteria bacterium GW2011_GWA1_34_13]
MKKNKLSAIIACYKDEQAIPIMYKRLKKTFELLKVSYEIIFVNDGSPDNSEKIIKTIVNRNKHVIGINHSRNFNSQMAFTSGMNIATGDAIVLLDGDLQDPPELIEQFYKKWQDGFDIIYGVRTKREAPLLMQFAYKSFYRIFHLLSYISIPLDAGDFSLIDRKVVEVLKTFPERDRYLRGLRAWVGFRQTGIPYKRSERMFGKTTNSMLKNFQWATKGIFSFSYVPLQIITILSLSVFVLSVLAMVIQIASRLLFPQLAPRGTSTILIVVLFIGSIQLLGISILGEYIGKIFEEVKQRPKYVIKSILKN